MPQINQQGAQIPTKVVHFSQENLTSFTPDELNNMFAFMPKELKGEIFNDMNLGKAILLVSMIQLDKKNDELEGIQGQLSRISDDIDFLNNEANAARAAAEKDRPHKWSARAKSMVEALGNETGQKIKVDTKSAETAIEQIGNASKRLSQKSKEISAKAQQLRTELTSFQEAMSGALQAFNKTIKGIAERTG